MTLKSTIYNAPAISLNSNERRIMLLVHEMGPITRAEIARTIDLSSPSVFRICDVLLQRGYLTPGNRKLGGIGQPSLPLSISADAAFSFGINLKTDSITLILMDITGQVRSRLEISTDIKSRLSVTSQIGLALQAMLAENKIERSKVAGVGLAAPGYFVGSGSKLNIAGGLDEWSLIDLEEELGKAFGYPAYVENDGNAAAIGESLYGQGKSQRSFAFISVGYGLGGGIVNNGVLYRGAHGNAGEITTILPNRQRADRPALSSLLKHLENSGIKLDGISDLVEKFDPNWPEFKDWLEKSKAPFAQILSSIAGVSDPAAIIIGGVAPLSLIQNLI